MSELNNVLSENPIMSHRSVVVTLNPSADVIAAAPNGPRRIIQAQAAPRAHCALEANPAATGAAGESIHAAMMPSEHSEISTRTNDSGFDRQVPVGVGVGGHARDSRSGILRQK
jgi:hypothetical protein